MSRPRLTPFPLILCLCAAGALVLAGLLFRAHAHRREVLSRHPASPPPSFPYRYASLRHHYRTADPARDLDEAWARGDRRFLALQGHGMVVPGVPRFHGRWSGISGLRVIERAPDRPRSRWQEDLVRAASAYAERYNRLLLDRLGG